MGYFVCGATMGVLAPHVSATTAALSADLYPSFNAWRF